MPTSPVAANPLQTFTMQPALQFPARLARTTAQKKSHSTTGQDTPEQKEPLHDPPFREVHRRKAF